MVMTFNKQRMLSRSLVCGKYSRVIVVDLDLHASLFFMLFLRTALLPSIPVHWLFSLICHSIVSTRGDSRVGCGHGLICPNIYICSRIEAECNKPGYTDTSGEIRRMNGDGVVVGHQSLLMGQSDYQNPTQTHPVRWNACNSVDFGFISSDCNASKRMEHTSCTHLLNSRSQRGNILRKTFTHVCMDISQTTRLSYGRVLVRFSSLANTHVLPVALLDL